MAALAGVSAAPRSVSPARAPSRVLAGGGGGAPAESASLPGAVFCLPDDQVAEFLRALWTANGSVVWDADGSHFRVHYPTQSRSFAEDLAQLLLRLGVYAKIKHVGDRWYVTVDGADGQAAFLSGIGHTEQARTHGIGDPVRIQISVHVRGLLSERDMTHTDAAAALGSRFCGSTGWRHSPSRSRLARVAQILDDAEIDILATNDVSWDRIVEIESVGVQDVFDGTVPGTNNFVAQGISVHNSLEQDADMVILLHRPDAFERDDPRGGEADLILGKHRNGPTATITVAHQLHLSRFVDMARG